MLNPKFFLWYSTRGKRSAYTRIKTKLVLVIERMTKQMVIYVIKKSSLLPKYRISYALDIEIYSLEAIN